MAKHVVVISNDALVYEDIATLKTLPTFSQLWDKMAVVDRVSSVYPTVTYPCHATMATGVWPEEHGIVNNETPELLVLGSKWHLMHEDVKSPDIFDAAKAKGLTTAAVFWPTTGLHPNIDYLVNEYWPQSEDESLEECFRNSGSSAEVMERVVKPNLHRLVNRTHPYCDDFIYSCAGAMLREFKPDLLMIHPANVDDHRHKSGVFSPRVTHGLHEIDSWMGGLIKAAKDAGIYEDTDFVMISDHGQLNVVRAVAVNAVFAREGLIDVAPDGSIADWKAFSKSAALSAQVYLKDPEDKEAYAATEKLLRRMCEEGVWGISRVFTAREAREEQHLAGGFSFVLETDGYTTFHNDWRMPIVRNEDISDYRYGRATHGYLPHKGPQPTLFAFGPDFKPGARLERAQLVDEAPTVAALLGAEMPWAKGRVLSELLK